MQKPAKLLNPFIEIDNALYFSVEDIAAMKMHTICGRGKRKDFFDIYALLEIYDWKFLTQVFEKKYDKSQFYILWKSIQYFADADEDPIMRGFTPFNKSWGTIKEIIIEKINII